MEELQRKISFQAFSMVIIIGVIALIGWIAGNLSLASIGKNYIPMAPATAISFIIISTLSILILKKNNNFRLIQTLLLLILAFHIVALFDSLIGYPIGIERIFWTSDNSSFNFILARMSPITIGLFLSGTLSSLLTTSKSVNWHKIAILLCYFGMLVAFVLDMGYFYGTPLLYGQIIIPPALTTSIAFTLLFTGILFGFGMQHFPLKLFVGESVGARLLRNFLPVTLLIIVLSGWVDLFVSQHIYDHIIVSTIVTILSVLLLGFIIIRIARKIGNDIDQIFAHRNEGEIALRKSEERYRLISSVATDYTFSTKVMADGSLDLDWVAGAFESISGYSVEEFKQRGGWRASIHPEDLTIDDNDITQLRNNHETISQLRTINRNGEVLWVQVFAHPVWDEQNNCLSGIYGAVRNINEQKLAEEKLIMSELRFRELLERVNLISIILDTDGKITFCNEYLLQLTGYKHEEMIGQDWFDMMIPENNSAVKDIFIDGLKTGKITPRFENPIKTKSGKELDIVWSNVTQRLANGSFSGIASIGEDITERKKVEEKIKSLNEELEERVIERTRELEIKNAELARMNNLFIGRELRMIELKNEIKELESKLLK